MSIVNGLFARHGYHAKPPTGTVINMGHPLARGLLAYYALSDVQPASGVLQDLTTLNGRANITGHASISGFVMGLHGGACPKFSGVGNYAVSLTGAGAKLDLTGNTVSLASWFRRDASGAFQGITGCPVSAGNDFKYAIRSTNADKLQGGIQTTSITGGTTINNGEWHFGAITYDGANIRLYLDGIEDATAVAKTGNIAASTSSFCIGTWTTGLQVWTGIIEFSAVWNRPLTQPEIWQLYESPWVILAQRGPMRATLDTGVTVLDPAKFPYPSYPDSPSMGFWAAQAYGSSSGIRTS